jgi:HlyD family secretion protein
MRRIIFLLILVGGIAAAYYATHQPVGSLTLTGIVTTEDVKVAPQVGGQIGQLLVKEGDELRKDQLVAVMTTEELQANREYFVKAAETAKSQIGENEATLRYQQRQTEDQIQQAQAAMATAVSQVGEAKAELENAKITLERTQKLSSEGVAPVQQLDQARTAYDAAKSRLETAEKQVDVQRAAVAVANANAEQVVVQRNRVATTERQHAAATAQTKLADVRLAYSEVRSPVDGIVDVRAARQGEVVNSGQAIITLVNPDDLWVRVDVEETYIDRIRLGDQLKVRLPSGEERTGTVFYRAMDAGFATQRDVSRTKRDIKTFEVRLRVDNKDRRLAVGMTTYIELPVS